MTTLPRRVRPFVACLFDFDETMINLERQHDVAHRALCTAMGSDYDDMPESFRFGSGRRLVDDVREMREHFGWTIAKDEAYAIRHAYFVEACRKAELQLMPGVERVVRELHAARLRLAITSSAAGDVIDELLRRFALRACFELIVDGQSVTRGKPNPEAYLVTASKLGVDPHDCIVFEDSEVGVIAARCAGAYCIAIRNPAARTLQNLDAADVVLDSLEELDVPALLA